MDKNLFKSRVLEANSLAFDIITSEFLRRCHNGGACRIQYVDFELSCEINDQTGGLSEVNLEITPACEFENCKTAYNPERVREVASVVGHRIVQITGPHKN